MTDSPESAVVDTKTTHRWITYDGQWWECDAYDHGAFCRQCRPVGERLPLGRGQ